MLKASLNVIGMAIACLVPTGAPPWSQPLIVKNEV